MRINYLAYYMQFDGYGRFNSRLVQALQANGVEVAIATQDHVYMPEWMLRQHGVDWGNLTISALPPYMLRPVPGRHWLYTMVEGSVVPEKWIENINSSGVERVLVPCSHNAKAYISSGLEVPINVLPGGTDPKEFPLLGPRLHYDERPYTFLALADRGFRKGWEEVWDAFYLAFGGKTSGDQDVRLIIKARPKSEPTTLDWMMKAEGADKRIVYDVSDPLDMYETYAQADCVVIPSRCEGWGMPHREAAMMGLPVITQAYSGLADADMWAIALKHGTIQKIPKENKVSLGEWMVADKLELAQWMRFCYTLPEDAKAIGAEGAMWLRDNQTWNHSARALVRMVRQTDAVQVGCAAVPVY